MEEYGGRLLEGLVLETSREEEHKLCGAFSAWCFSVCVGTHSAAPMMTIPLCLRD